MGQHRAPDRVNVDGPRSPQPARFAGLEHLRQVRQMRGTTSLFNASATPASSPAYLSSLRKPKPKRSLYFDTRTPTNASASGRRPRRRAPRARVGRVEVRGRVELGHVTQDRRGLREHRRLARRGRHFQGGHLAELQPARRLQRLKLRAVREAVVLKGDVGVRQRQADGFLLAREVEVEELVGGGVFSFSLRHPCRVLCALHGGVYAVQPLCLCCAVLCRAVLCCALRPRVLQPLFPLVEGVRRALNNDCKETRRRADASRSRAK